MNSASLLLLLLLSEAASSSVKHVTEAGTSRCTRVATE
jgi:hypothetical protein